MTSAITISKKFQVSVYLSYNSFPTPNITGAKNYINRENKNVYDYLINRFNDIDENTTLKEIVYRIEHHIEIIPKCPICGNRIPYTSKYGTYCSKKC
jgi:hypothetical protein